MWNNTFSSITMTIHADWIHLFKTWAPQGFTPDIPQTPVAGFIDGQIKLMGFPRSESGIPCWNHFLRSKFVTPIQRMWRQGAKVVVLAFDDYANVPKAKAITQASRRRNTPVMPFSEGDALPNEPPEPWEYAMANRAFKAKVQQLICESLPRLLRAPGSSIANNNNNAAMMMMQEGDEDDDNGDDEVAGVMAMEISIEEEEDGRRKGETDDDDDADDDYTTTMARRGGSIAAAHPHHRPSSSTVSTTTTFTLIIDWRGEHLQHFSWNVVEVAEEEEGDGGGTMTMVVKMTAKSAVSATLSPREPIGEADVKLIWWAKHLKTTTSLTTSASEGQEEKGGGIMAVEATDGDYIPISLLLHENCADTSLPIAILRMETNAPRPQITTTANGASSSSTTDVRQTPPPQHRSYEWVSIPCIHEMIQLHIGKGGFEALIVLIALTGTDFSRGLPLIGPKKMTKNLPGYIRGARSCIRVTEEEEEEGGVITGEGGGGGGGEGISIITTTTTTTTRQRQITGKLSVDSVSGLDLIVSPIYAKNYEKHVTGSYSFERVMRDLERSKTLSNTTKDRFPSTSQAMCTLNNATFLLHYWSGSTPENSIQPELYGFRYAEDQKTVEWAS